MSAPNSTTVQSDLASVVQRFRNSHAWLVEGKPVSHGAAATDFGIAADAIEALQAELAQIRTLRVVMVDMLNRVKAWRDCDGNDGFPGDLRDEIDALILAVEAGHIKP